MAWNQKETTPANPMITSRPTLNPMRDPDELATSSDETGAPAAGSLTELSVLSKYILYFLLA